MSKIHRVMHIYDSVASGIVLDRNELAQGYDINPRSVSRDIKKINDYFRDNQIKKRIKHDKKKGGYVLKSKQGSYFNEKEVLAISKILLDSRGLCSDEMKSLIKKLQCNLIGEDKKLLENSIENEQYYYMEPKHREYLIDKLWDINYAIKKQKLVEINYCKVGTDKKVQTNSVTRIIEPRGILFTEYYFYVMAQIHGKEYDNPITYRLDRIKDYKVLKDGYSILDRDRFKGGEFRENIQSMETGGLEQIKFKFKGRSLECVLDRIPTAKVVQENNGEYIIKAKAFNIGLKKWILSQGNSVEVLEPKKFRDEIREEIQKMFKIYE